MTDSTTTPAIFGEVLFDVFPDGHAVMGGAPFNVAWHLQGLGLSPLMLTAVGDDANGEAVLTSMRDWGMDTAGVQIDTQHPTGRVSITLEGSMPSYDIVADQAYDFIDAGNSQQVIDQHQCGLLYHGSLAVRTANANAQLNTIKTNSNLDAFVDVNLRDPWWSVETINDMLGKARWVKLNDEELATVMKQSLETIDNYHILARQCLDKYQLERLIVTMGDKGAFCVTQDTIIEGEPVPASNVIDTVGAGDSFSAVVITGLINDWPLETTLKRALRFASALCEIRGATTKDRALYDRFLEQWQ